MALSRSCRPNRGVSVPVYAGRLLWCTGHYSCVRQTLAGRQAGFDRLPKSGGVSGYPNREESAHDPIENAHVSAALSCADGRAGADDHLGRRDSPLRESASRGGSSATAGHTRSRGMRSHQPPGVNPHFRPRCAGATRLFAESGGRTPSKPTRHDSVPEACRT
ncbi:1-deoxy-D-xylulose-5-phosphate synthase N-terminal domain-containing protein [Streptomyces sp. NPDC012623]|uniref:1-deoxy-D-xylulose-5-phosphate synthase N-terminal domain-containing protein n=1 Tax=unclassified Streptomyces TaxID=2593676 RepID=UPI00369B5274